MSTLGIKAIDGMNINGVLLCYMVCMAALILRFGSRFLFTRLIPWNDALEVSSHYFQWMPVIIIGHLSNKRRILDKADNALEQRVREKKTILYALMLTALYVGKCVVMFITGIYSNFDSLIILPFMIALVGTARWLLEVGWVKKCFGLLGCLSMYLWLSHSFILYPQVQAIVLSTRFPILILLISFAIMIPIAYLLKTIDSLLVRLDKGSRGGTA